MVISPVTAADRLRVQTIADLCHTRVDLDAELNRDWAMVWVARERQAEEAIAFLLAWRAADEIHVIDIGTHPSYRRRGAARSLLERLLLHARSVGSRVMVLEVRQSNRPAIRLYESLGFTVARVRRSYYADPGEDGLEMVLMFDQKRLHSDALDPEAAVK
jgi:ribosomal-protein-alanine N-acetyltransferase